MGRSRHRTGAAGVRTLQVSLPGGGAGSQQLPFAIPSVDEKIEIFYPHLGPLPTSQRVRPSPEPGGYSYFLKGRRGACGKSRI